MGLVELKYLIKVDLYIKQHWIFLNCSHKDVLFPVSQSQVYQFVSYKIKHKTLINYFVYHEKIEHVSSQIGEHFNSYIIVHLAPIVLNWPRTNIDTTVFRSVYISLNFVQFAALKRTVQHVAVEVHQADRFACQDLQLSQVVQRSSHFVLYDV